MIAWMWSKIEQAPMFHRNEYSPHMLTPRPTPTRIATLGEDCGTAGLCTTCDIAVLPSVDLKGDSSYRRERGWEETENDRERLWVRTRQSSAAEHSLVQVAAVSVTGTGGPHVNPFWLLLLLPMLTSTRRPSCIEMRISLRMGQSTLNRDIARLTL